MKMTSAEKVFLDKIVADSGEDITVVRHILRAILISLLKETYASYSESDSKDHVTTEFYVPYLLKMRLDFKNVLTKDSGEKTEIKITCEPTITLDKDINRIFSDTPTDTEEFFTQEISLNLMNILEFDKDTIIDAEPE